MIEKIQSEPNPYNKLEPTYSPVNKITDRILLITLAMTAFCTLWSIPYLKITQTRFSNVFWEAVLLPIIFLTLAFIISKTISKALNFQILISVTLAIPLVPAFYNLLNYLDLSGGIRQWWFLLLVGVINGIWFTYHSYLREIKILQRLVNSDLASYKLDVKNKTYNLFMRPPIFVCEHSPDGHNSFRQKISAVSVLLAITTWCYVGFQNKTNGLALFSIVILTIILAYFPFLFKLFAEALVINQIEKRNGIRLMVGDSQSPVTENSPQRICTAKNRGDSFFAYPKKITRGCFYILLIAQFFGISVFMITPPPLIDYFLTWIIPAAFCLATLLTAFFIERALYLQILMACTVTIQLLPLYYGAAIHMQVFGGFSEWRLVIYTSLAAGIWLSIRTFNQYLRRLTLMFNNSDSNQKLDIKNHFYDLTIEPPPIDLEKENLMKALAKLVQAAVYPTLPIISRILSRNLNEQQGGSFMVVLFLVILVSFQSEMIKFFAEAYEIHRIEKRAGKKLYVNFPINIQSPVPETQ
ncbi:hypothetical protein ADN00_12275 [Ornatilinea apprima]|uniref:Uncharacterized protein n=1 Tax=Ornatilinea apprima TaxID=1134406 RepID=A0A0P6X3Z4_9CHLR|nr:hypothetical protein [Ornatilinea apprima]KPL76110.1 hypothetical protein ADN00_12275 [Ornatilinea apprima]